MTRSGTAQLSPFKSPRMECECGKTSDFCDNGLCYTWPSKLWRWLKEKCA